MSLAGGPSRLSEAEKLMSLLEETIYEKDLHNSRLLCYCLMVRLIEDGAKEKDDENEQYQALVENGFLKLDRPTQKTELSRLQKLYGML